jgi:hypothetical protein
MFGGDAAGEEPTLGVCGVEAERGSLWPGPLEERESG